jgi:drug/metabolite transporter (DMT)-like permease
MTGYASGRLAALLLAVFVTFLWSTSWVLIKVGLAASLPPLSFAGLRYGLAVLCLAPFALGSAAARAALRAAPRGTAGRLALLGLVYIAVAQGGQFAALALLPAATVSIFLAMTPAVVALASAAARSEPPTGRQWAGIGVAASGAVLYFRPESLAVTSAAGLAAALVSLAANAAGSLLGRKVNRETPLAPLLVTFVSLAVGAVVLLSAGVATEGLPPLDATAGAVVAWLAVVNTAVAFTLWNRTLKTLTAVESSVVNGLMLPQIAILAVVVLGEPLGLREVAGLALVGAGTLVVQLPPAR